MQREDIDEMLTCLLARELPYALHASKAKIGTQMHRHAQNSLYLTRSQESAAGMIRSRH